MWTHAKGIKTIERGEGKARVHILERDDGLYEYRGEAEIQGNELSGLEDWMPRTDAVVSR
jgi:hypothetical protein